MVVLVAVQVTLGALTVLSQRDVWINSVHLVCGALVLATSIVITLRSWQMRIADEVRLKPDPTRVLGDERGVRLQPDLDPRLQPNQGS
jgi:heme A synthase